MACLLEKSGKAAVLLTGNINRVKEFDVSAVNGNKTLAACVERRAVERCKDAIVSLGVLHTPVIGTAEGGKRELLFGQCELTALRELGVKKMEAVEVDVKGGGGEMAKLSLLLMSLREAPGALHEGLLLQEAVNAGVPRTEIQVLLGKSASWVSNRLSLVTRLDSGVYEMVRNGLLDPRSAQEVARLPEEKQFAFAENAIREGLPKSSIEALVAGFNDNDCPDEVKAQILGNPREALKRMTDKRRAVNTDNGLHGHRHKSARPNEIQESVKETRTQIAILYGLLYYESPYSVTKHKKAIKELEEDLVLLLTKVSALVSPGKTEVV